MKPIENIYRQIIIFATLLLFSAMPAIAQTKHTHITGQLNDFHHLLADAGLNFTFPAGFIAIPAINNEDFSFDYALSLPGKDFEVWYQVKSQKQNWISYEHTKNDKKTALANPDSLYLDMGRANAIALTGDNNFMIRNLPPQVLARYNADAGKSCLLNLLDMPVTKHYKYALLITLQKNHTGTLMAIYFTNNKDPDFYQYVSRAGRCLRFKQQPAI
jgi:hypothetical protein